MSWRRLLAALTAVIVCLVYFGATATAMSTGDLNDINDQNPNYDSSTADGTGCSTTGTTVSDGDGSGPTVTDANQADTAKIIMGVVKTEGLSERAALIALMVSLAESHITIYANDGTFKAKDGSQPYINTQLGPISTSLPHQAVGHDNDSLGVFQQRITAGWSTISSDPNDKATIQQLMDPAYNIEAFLGTPAGTNVTGVANPGALQKGLLNKVPDFESVDPWTASQTVQVSGTADGSNYKAQMDAAQSLLDQYWNDAPSVPLPVAFDNPGATGTEPAKNGPQCFANVGGAAGGGGSIVDTALKLAWPEPFSQAPASEKPPQGPRTGELTPTDAYQAALEQFNKTGLGAPGHGADCGVFVATVLHASGADPNYPDIGTYTQEPYVRSHPEMYQVLDDINTTGDLQPGDILIVNGSGGGGGADGHTMIYVGPQKGGFNEASASGVSRMASLGTTPTNLVDPSYPGHASRGHYLVARLIKGAS